MLSILIPVYNYPLEMLLSSLLKELNSITLNWEIIVLDDCSTDKETALANQLFCDANKVSFFKNKKNIGRTATRNKMAEIAKNNYLLFLDSDTKPVKENFTQNFISQINNHDVICGGVAYLNNVPKKELTLRWKYGHVRESQSFDKRNKKPYLSIISACFLIKKEQFISISKSILDNKYGMDVVFAYEMEKRNLTILHIDNPVFHLGLETNLEFIAKTEMAMSAIIHLQNTNRIPYNYRPIQEKLLLLKKLKMVSFFIFCVSKMKKTIIKHLNSEKPNLYVFDIYRLYCLCLHNNKIK